MKVISGNVNGLGGERKRGLVKEVILRASLDPVFIQETKLEQVDSFLFGSIWDPKHKEWGIFPSLGALGFGALKIRSGGIS